MDEKGGTRDLGLAAGDATQASSRQSAAPDSQRPTIVYADGSSRGNPGPGGWGSLVVTPDDHVIELGGVGGHTTNNRMEMNAAIEALVALQTVAHHVCVYTDSSYLINGITKWVHGWRKRGWRTVDGKEVLNRDLWETLSRVVTERGVANRVSWHHVPGHAGVPGNERVDTIATAFACGERCDLYDGPLRDYTIPILDSVPSTAAADLGSKRSSGASKPAKKTYSYLSLVGGEARRHATWAECEARVKGVSGAKFKKSTSADDEINIVRSWGAALPATTR